MAPSADTVICVVPAFPDTLEERAPVAADHLLGLMIRWHEHELDVPTEASVLVFGPGEAARSPETARHLVDQAEAMVDNEGAGDDWAAEPLQPCNS